MISVEDRDDQPIVASIMCGGTRTGAMRQKKERGSSNG
jgi:hypothetical protein